MSTVYVVIENRIPYPNIFITYSSVLNAIIEKHNTLDLITLVSINEINDFKDFSDTKSTNLHIYIYKLNMP